MKKRMGLWAAVFLSLLLIGCRTQVGLSDGRDEYLKSIKFPIEYWEKDGVTREERARDSIGCGGSDLGPTPSQERINAARKLGENKEAADARLFHEWQRCMLRHSYRYTGKCYDNEIGRASPACAGRVLEPLR